MTSDLHLIDCLAALSPLGYDIELDIVIRQCDKIDSQFAYYFNNSDSVLLVVLQTSLALIMRKIKIKVLAWIRSWYLAQQRLQ